jgi:hypothetical protein
METQKYGLYEQFLWRNGHMENQKKWIIILVLESKKS